MHDIFEKLGFANKINNACDAYQRWNRYVSADERLKIRTLGAKIARQCQSLELHLFIWGERTYPRVLSEVPNPPLVFYGRGHKDRIQQPLLAVVGTRQPNAYGLLQVKRLVTSLQGAGYATLSGFARGIDAAVHRESLLVHVPTVALLPCGLAQCYPQEHAALAQQVLAQGGLLLSPFAPYVATQKAHFALRNHLLVSLARAVVLIQGRLRSGSSMTARLCIEAYRDLWVVPGDVDDPLSQAPHAWLQQGAYPLVDRQHFLQALGQGERQRACIHTSF